MEDVAAREAVLPEDLRADNYDYPASLFDDWDKVLRFEGSDDIPAPVTNIERTVLMAKYAVAQAASASFSEGTLVRIARGEIEVGLIASIRKIWHGQHKGYGGLEKGDIELAAEELDVYELIWPFNQEKMQEAIEAERRGEPISGLDAEVVADAFNDVSDHDLGLDQVVVNT